MKIYRIVPDVNHYLNLLAEDSRVWQGDSMIFDCAPKSLTWTAPDVYVLHPKLKRGNFFGFCPGALVFDIHAAEQLRSMLEMSGELLPLHYKGEQLYLLNVTECINVLDDSKTQWAYGKTTNKKIRIKEYAFHPGRLTEAPLFKIPETCKSEILTAEGLRDPRDEFKFNVEHNGLKGLVFEQVWSDN